MSKIWFRVFFLWFCGFICICSRPAAAAPPSFDCSQATKPDEIAICQNALLSEMDNIANSGYLFVRSARGIQFANELDTPLLRERQSCGNNVHCILNVQIETIKTFQSYGAPSSGPARQAVIAAAATTVPKFAQFPMPIYRGLLGRLNLTSPDAFGYRTRLREGSRHSVNFAGHYQLILWGCGTTCTTGAFIDAQTGQVSFLPQVTTEGMEAINDAAFKTIEFRPDSRLIVFSGRLNGAGVLGTHFDVWDGVAFKEVATVPFGALAANGDALPNVTSTQGLGDGAGADQSSSPSTSSASIEIPLEQQGGTLVVPVQINGVITLKFIIDSGASDVSIPADVVLTLIRAGTIQQSDFNGRKTFRLADGSTVPSIIFVIRNLKVGDISLQNVQASVADVKGGLLLGQTFLNRFKTWSIDNERQVLSLSELTGSN